MAWLRGLGVALICLLVACGDDSAPEEDAGEQDVSETCASDTMCSDGLFCNGDERCDPGAAGADANGCVAGSDPCGGSICVEADARCDCTNPDADGDGVDSVGCGGDDCDDANPDRYPGNTELCDDEIDEDCDPTTLGPDRDGDGFVDIVCCNRTTVGLECGTDCDDELSGVNPGTPESCNGSDEDCDGNIDEDVSTLCAADADNDGFAPMGAMEMAFCESCTELDNWASPPRFPTEIDCDDGDPTVNPGATELCDGIDSDCSDDGVSPAPDEDADGDGFASMTSSCSGGPLQKLDCNDRDDRVRPNQTSRFHVPHCLSGADVGCWRPTSGGMPEDGEWSCAYPQDRDEDCDTSGGAIPGSVAPSWDFNCNSMLEPEEQFRYADCACTSRCGARVGDVIIAAGPARGPAQPPEASDCGALVSEGRCVNASGVIGGFCGLGNACMTNSSATPAYRVRCR